MLNSTRDNNMQLDSLPSLKDDDELFEDNDKLVGLEENFDVMETLIPLMITYGQYVLQDL
jgi:hypothetical protein